MSEMNSAEATHPTEVQIRGPVIVTGGAQGIGLAIARHLVRDGRSVALWDMDEQRLAIAREEVASVGEAAGAQVHTAVVNVADPESVAKAHAEAVEMLGTPSGLVNNAGILGWRGPVKDLPLERWNQALSVNLTGALICSQVALPGMLEQGYGRIVNMASIAGKDGNAGNAGYAASKAGLIGLTKSMGKELAKDGVLVNCVTPAAADTTIFDHQDPEARDELRQRLLSLVPMGRYVEVEEIAEIVAWLLSDKCSFSTGAVFDISGGRAVY
ncbi:MAG: SDR family NAD(P)-dependent oxidoreductase [Micrococcaceae bacterium]